MLKNIFLFCKKKGSATISVLATVVILVGTTAAGFLVTISRQNEVKNEHGRQQIYYIAESAVSVAIAQINGVNKKLAIEPTEGAGNIGSKENPISLLGGKCYVTTLAKQGSEKNIWIVAAAADTKNYTGNLQATFRHTLPPFPGCVAGLSGGDKGIHLDSNAMVDSYDSSKGSYDGNAKENGHISSNGNIQLDSNSRVLGNAQAAPGYKTTISGNAVVAGITANLPEPLHFDPVKLPTNITTPDSVYFKTLGDHIINSGNYKYTNFIMDSNSTVTVKAPAVLYITGNFLLNSNSQFKIDNTNPGGVTIYIKGKFIMDSNTQLVHINNPRGWPEPGNFRVESTYKTTYFTYEIDSAVNLKSNTDFYGSVYAPDGTVMINSNANFFGAFAGRKVEMDSNGSVHYDEALKIKTNPNDPTGGALNLQKWDWSFKKK